MLYHCSLSDEVETGDGEPRMVMLRIYGQIIQESIETVVTDSVVFALLAEKNMGPQLLGVFTGGRVEEYVPVSKYNLNIKQRSTLHTPFYFQSRHLHTRELHDPEMSRQCATVMARFHKLCMPFSKEPRWLSDIITR
jgi:choline/ethanolamine kinase